MFPDKPFNLKYQNVLSFDFLAWELLARAFLWNEKFSLIGQKLILIG